MQSTFTGRGQRHSMQDTTQTILGKKGNDLQVKVESYDNIDIAGHSPLGNPIPAATMPSSGTAIGLLDKLLARSRTVHRKLDMLTTPPSGGSADTETRVARGPSMSAGQPAAILDRCLARTQSLHQKVDRVSAEVKARSPRDRQVQVINNETNDASAHSPLDNVATVPLALGSHHAASTTPTGRQAATRHLVADVTYQAHMHDVDKPGNISP